MKKKRRSVRRKDEPKAARASKGAAMIGMRRRKRATMQN